MSSVALPSEIQARTARICALVLDVDGVLTDGRVTYLPGGGEYKVFHVRDGLGVQLLMNLGYPVAVISGHRSEVAERRCQELGVEHLYFGINDKLQAFEQVLVDLELEAEEVAYVGDDLPDIAVIERAGLGLAVADAAYEVRQAADFVLRNAGGHGAVREACERILKAKGEWQVT